MSQLRDKENGCEWDKEQTFETISPYTIEEAYEVADAIERSNKEDIKEELGDLLLQVVFLSQIAKEEKSFEFNDVVQVITDKLIRRHPYVFSKKKSHSSDEQIDKWEEIKAQERIEKKQEGILDGIAQNLPALNRSQKIQKRAAKVGFDWPDVGGIFEKIKGLIIGELHNFKDQDIPFGKSTDEIIMDVCGHLDIPIVTNFPCGHGKYQCTIPLSVQIELNALKNKPYITTLESAVLDT